MLNQQVNLKCFLTSEKKNDSENEILFVIENSVSSKDILLLKVL